MRGNVEVMSFVQVSQNTGEGKKGNGRKGKIKRRYSKRVGKRGERGIRKKEENER